MNIKIAHLTQVCQRQMLNLVGSVVSSNIIACRSNRDLNPRLQSLVCSALPLCYWMNMW